MAKNGSVRSDTAYPPFSRARCKAADRRRERRTLGGPSSPTTPSRTEPSRRRWLAARYSRRWQGGRAGAERPCCCELMRTLDPHSLPQHVDRLYRAAWALCGSREDAEDLVQETFARVLSRPRMLRGDDELYYLMRVLRNTFLTGLRTASRRPVTSTSIEDVVVADPKPTDRPERAFEVQEIYATIATLPDNFRLALVAVDVLGLSYREAARALRIREATLTTRLFRARKQVAERLNATTGSAPAAGEVSAAAVASQSTSAPRADDSTGEPASQRPRIADAAREGTDTSGVSIGEGLS
jgi:RNA polymerase sigma-70 factor, ECF subfamily